MNKLGLTMILATSVVVTSPVACAAPAIPETVSAPASGPAANPGKRKKLESGGCKADRERLCAQSRGRDAVRACMVAHRNDLSAACRTKIDDAEAERRDCTAEAERLCAEVKPGHGRIMACLIGRKTDVQPACRKHVDAIIKRNVAHAAKKKARANAKAP